MALAFACEAVIIPGGLGGPTTWSLNRLSLLLILLWWRRLFFVEFGLDFRRRRRFRNWNIFRRRSWFVSGG